MTSLKSRSSIALIVLALIAAPALADEQDNVLTREGNTWDLRHHEPNPSVVHRHEDAAGVDLSKAQEEKANTDVESLYRQLVKNKEASDAEAARAVRAGNHSRCDRGHG